MKIVAIILARGGSKEIPKKNIIDINGNPLIYYAINAANQSKVQETWVSTDDSDIKRISLSYGAKVLDRPEYLAGDKASSESALLHFAEIVDFDWMVFIQPTSPFIHHEYINRGLEKMPAYDSLFSCYKEEWTPRWSTIETAPQNMYPVNWDGINRPRRQDSKDVWVENGAFYITTREALLKSKLRFSGKIGHVEMPFHKSFQIDTYEDLDFIRTLFLILENKNKVTDVPQ